MGEELKTSTPSEFRGRRVIDEVVVIMVKVETNGASGGGLGAVMAQVLQRLSTRPVQWEEGAPAQPRWVSVPPAHLCLGKSHPLL